MKKPNPSPAEIHAMRKSIALSQTAAAALIFTTCRAWQYWESGERKMHPAFWELFLIKILEKETDIVGID